MTLEDSLDEEFFRRQAGQLTASYARLFGAHHLDLAERVVHSTLRQALRRWPYEGLPDNPGAWLHAEALRQAQGILQREGTVRSRILLLLQEFLPADEETVPTLTPVEPAIVEDELKLLFLCCHPQIAEDARIPLLLKALCGWGEREIAVSLEIETASLGRKLADARRKIRARRLSLQFPSGAERDARVALTAWTLYELFTVCGPDTAPGREAMRLALRWSAHAQGQHPAVHALLACFLLRKGARPSAVQEGLDHLELAGQSGPIVFLHLAAGRAACEMASSPSYAAAKGRILEFYDLLFARSDTPEIALQRAATFLELLGEDAGAEALARGAGSRSLTKGSLLQAAEAELCARRGNSPRAKHHYRSALLEADTWVGRRYLMRRLNTVESFPLDAY